MLTSHDIQILLHLKGTWYTSSGHHICQCNILIFGMHLDWQVNRLRAASYSSSPLSKDSSSVFGCITDGLAGLCSPACSTSLCMPSSSVASSAFPWSSICLNCILALAVSF
eukprot:c25668_g2_i1 orf=523-855(+)